jgi:hypothetical protein
LKVFVTGSGVREGIGDWINCYNETRPHSKLDHRLPHEANLDLPLPCYTGKQVAYPMLLTTLKLPPSCLTNRFHLFALSGAITDEMILEYMVEREGNPIHNNNPFLNDIP